MKRTLLALGMLGLSGAVLATPVTYDFYGVNNSGEAAATMQIDIDASTNTLTAILNNVSPTSLIDGTGINSPGITGFGFDLNPDTLNWTSWDLKAKDSSGVEVDIDNFSGGNAMWLLTVGGNFNGIKVDYTPNTDNGVNGALYNPNAVTGFGANPYFTEAVFTMVFNETPTFDSTGLWSPFVRMQNVGVNGAGSVKLAGSNQCAQEPCGGGFNEVPAPAPLALMGIGLLGLFAARRRIVAGK